MFADAHLHSNPIKGIGAGKIAENFKKSGGWFIALVMLPTWDYGEQATNLEKFMKVVEKHHDECAYAKEKGIKTACFAGLHPAELDKLANKGMEPYKIKEYAISTIDYLYKRCEDKFIDGIGEVGRQHYKIKPEIAIITQEVLEYIFTIQKDYDCPLQLHLENTKNFTARNISEMIKRKGANRDKILIHHAKPGVLDEAINYRLWATTPGLYDSLKIALQRLTRKEFMIESDYIDDIKRPGKVLYPWDIPSVFNKLLEENIIDSSTIEKLNVDNIEKFFDIKH